VQQPGRNVGRRVAVALSNLVVESKLNRSCLTTALLTDDDTYYLLVTCKWQWSFDGGSFHDTGWQLVPCIDNCLTELYCIEFNLPLDTV